MDFSEKGISALILLRAALFGVAYDQSEGQSANSPVIVSVFLVRPCFMANHLVGQVIPRLFSTELIYWP